MGQHKNNLKMKTIESLWKKLSPLTVYLIQRALDEGIIKEKK